MLTSEDDVVDDASAQIAQREIENGIVETIAIWSRSERSWKLPGAHRRCCDV